MTTQDPELSAALGWPGGISDPVLDRTRLLHMVATLRLASQQALEACEQRLPLKGQAAIIDELNNLRAALVQQDELDHETRAELAEQQVVQLAEERDHYRNLWQKAQQDEPAQDSGFWGRVAARQASRIKQLETAAQQALEALEFCTPKPRPTDDDYAEQGWKEHNAAITALRAVLAQQKDPTDPGNDVDVLREHVRHLERRVRELHAQKPEPVEDPVAWLAPRIVDSYSRPDLGYETCSKSDYGAFPAYTAPPQRTMVPLTEEEILAAVGWERAAMYMKLTPNFPVDEAKKETLTNARAVEKASWEKNHGQA